MTNLPKVDSFPGYQPPEDPYIFPLHERLSDMLEEKNQVVLDPSALPLLPDLIEFSDYTLHIPQILFQLFSIQRDGIPDARIPEVPKNRQSFELRKLAEQVVSRWISRSNNVNWDEIQGALVSPKCVKFLKICDISCSICKKIVILKLMIL